MTPKDTTRIHKEVERIRKELDHRRYAYQDGGPGSGNFGHQGRPGKVGGSASEGTASTQDIKSWLDSLKKSHSSAPKAIGKTAGMQDYSEDRKEKAVWLAPKPKTHSTLISDTSRVWKGLNSVQKWAVREYTGNNYPAFAKALSSDAYKDRTAGNYERECIKGITQALNQASLPCDIWIDRGASESAMAKTLQVSVEEVQNALKNPKALKKLSDRLVGQSLTQKVFLSGSPKKDAGFPTNYKLKIYAPKGSKVLYTEPFSIAGNGPRGWNGEPYSVARDIDIGEFEVLTQRNSDLVINSITVNRGKLLVVADLITYEVND